MECNEPRFVLTAILNLLLSNIDQMKWLVIMLSFSMVMHPWISNTYTYRLHILKVSNRNDSSFLILCVAVFGKRGTIHSRANTI
jgi:hypothetical protein